MKVTNENILTGKEFIQVAAKTMGVEPKYMVVKKRMLSLLGLFDKVIKENNEMLYQSNSDYLFDSKKSEKTFCYEPISYEEGIINTAESIKK